MRHVAEKQGLVLEQFYEQVGWPLYKKYGHAFDAFKLAVTYVGTAARMARATSEQMSETLLDASVLGHVLGGSEPDKVFEDLTMTPEVREELLNNIRRRLTPQPVKIRSGANARSIATVLCLLRH